MNQKKLKSIMVFISVSSFLFLGCIYATGMNHAADSETASAIVVQANDVEGNSGTIKISSSKKTTNKSSDSSNSTEAPLKMTKSVNTENTEKSRSYDDEPASYTSDTEEKQSDTKTETATSSAQTSSSADTSGAVAAESDTTSGGNSTTNTQTGSASASTVNYSDFTVPSTVDEAKTALTSLLKSGAFLRWKKNSEGVMYKAYPKLAYAYYDITTGDTFGFNADTVMYSASLIKAPYIWAVLKEIDAFEALEHERDENGKIIYSEENKKYDLDDIWIYDPDTMKQAGSGVIIEEEKGFTLTWRELFDYAILYSDNVAFAQIRNRFGYSSYYTEAARLGISGTSTGFMQLSANDCVKFLKEIYAYFDTGTENALRLRANMANSNEPEMIVNNFTSTAVVHKYGWDKSAFHDMAIVLDEKPYILVIMTDYEDGGDEPLEMFRRICELTKVIHSGGTASDDTGDGKGSN